MSAVRALDRRLSELPAGTAAGPEPSSDANRAEAVRSQAARRAKRLASLLDLVGEDAAAKNLGAAVELNDQVNALSQASGADSSSEWAPLVGTWSGLARVARFVYVRLAELLEQPARPDSDDRPGWVAPAFLVSLDANPVHEVRVREASAMASWLAENYRHQGHDLHDEAEPLAYYDTATLECARIGEPAADRYLELSPASAAGPVLTAKQPSAEIGVQVNLHAPDPENPRKVAFLVKSVDDPRLAVSFVKTPEQELTPEKPVTLRLKVEWDEKKGRSDIPPPAGFLLQATLAGQRSFHLLMPVRPEWKTILPTLVLSSTAGEPTEVPFDRFRLRALPGRQPFFVFVRNPAPTPRQVVVEIIQGQSILATSDPKGLPVPGRSTVAVPGFGAPASTPKEPQALPEAAPGLRLRLREAAGAPGQEYDRPAAPAHHLEPRRICRGDAGSVRAGPQRPPESTQARPPDAPPDDRPALLGRARPARRQGTLPRAPRSAPGTALRQPGAGQGAGPHGG